MKCASPAESASAGLRDFRHLQRVEEACPQFGNALIDGKRCAARRDDDERRDREQLLAQLIEGARVLGGTHEDETRRVREVVGHREEHERGSIAKLDVARVPLVAIVAALRAGQRGRKHGLQLRDPALHRAALAVVGDELLRSPRRLAGVGDQHEVVQEEFVRALLHDHDDAAQSLPRLQKGQPLRAAYEVKAKKTQPPPRYTEATLLSAMEGAGKQLDDEALQEALKDRGLGTPATRAAVIETLLDRGYITRQGKQLQPTPLGMDLIARLPVSSLGSAQLTGQWEERLSRMADVIDCARYEMTSLYQQLSDGETAVVLTDTEGVILHMVTSADFASQVEPMGLRVGAMWSETTAGTNGMGTCLAAGGPVSVRREDHFFTQFTQLTCSAVPVYDPSGEIAAVLDVTSRSSLMQQHLLVLLGMTARMIENRLIDARYCNAHPLHFHSRPEFVYTLHEGKLAVGDDGRILAANRSALFQLGMQSMADIRARRIEDLFQTSLEDMLNRSTSASFSARSGSRRKKTSCNRCTYDTLLDYS